MLDKFNTSTFAQEQTSITGSRIISRHYSPRVAILGGATFSTDGHTSRDRVVKIADEPSNTVTKQISRIHVSQLYSSYNTLLIGDRSRRVRIAK